ncbi:spore coat protein U domain-containing protein, partial [Alphaproteobacteria bacterium]|nr:spore coat protein U domain-containing protein [Alphaproteobacteria bacterium]
MLLAPSANVYAQAASGSVTTSLTIEAGCTMGTDAVVFTNTVSNNVTEDWVASDNLSFACSVPSEGSLSAVVYAKRESSNGSAQLVNASGDQVPYLVYVNGSPVGVLATIVMSTPGQGLGTFIDIPVLIKVTADNINAAEPSTYSNVVSVEIFLI